MRLVACLCFFGAVCSRTIPSFLILAGVALVFEVGHRARHLHDVF